MHLWGMWSDLISGVVVAFKCVVVVVIVATLLFPVAVGVVDSERLWGWAYLVAISTTYVSILTP